MAPRQTTTTGTPSSPQQKQVYDVIVIGGGSAGLTAAKLSANTLQKRCVLVENNRLGADCTWTGCIPSKSLLAAAKNHYSATSTKNPRPKADFAKIQEQIQRNIQQIYEEDDSPETLTGLGVDVVLGQAVLISSNAVTVGQTTTEGGIASGTVLELHAKEGIILCTGAQPRIPTSIAGLDDTNYVTYETIWNLPSVPDRLTIVGGGPIGCEIGQAFQRLGAQVTIVTDQPVLLPKEDPVVGKLLEEVFVAEGMTICRGRVVRVEQQQQQHVCTCDNGQTVQGDVLLLAVGRVPRCSGMGLETVGVALTHNQEAIAVNSKLQTSVKGIYAAGDCTGDRQLYVSYLRCIKLFVLIVLRGVALARQQHGTSSHLLSKGLKEIRVDAWVTI